MPTQITGDNMLRTGAFNAKSTIEDFLKIEYTEGMRNEFALRPSLVNKLSKDTITGKKKYRSFALGIVDNVRGLGRTNDTYQVGYADFLKGAETVDAEFDTVKFIGVFAITDEAIMKGTSDGSLLNVVQDTLGRMQTGLEHTQNRYVYGSKTGLIGKTIGVAQTFADSGTAMPGVQMGRAAITKQIFKLRMSNSYSMISGMGVMLKSVAGVADMTKSGGTVAWAVGKIWQVVNTVLHSESIIVIIDKTESDATITAIPEGVEIYSRQFANDGNVQSEYTGLQDIVIAQDNTIFGVNRAVYPSLNCPQKDLHYQGVDDQSQVNHIVTEEDLRDMADHVDITSPDGSKTNLVCARHRVISAVEKSLYQHKEYSMDGAQNGFQLGRPDIRFDTYQLMKDKYSREMTDASGGAILYMLDTTKIGELLRKDFDWITDGREGILERINGTEVFEAIMTKYADMYIDAWRAHASFVHVSETLGG